MDEQVQQEIKAFESNAALIKIESDEAFITAQEDLKRARVIEKRVGELLDPIIKKAHAAHKEAVGQKKNLLMPLQKAVGLIRIAAGAYQKKKEDEARRKQAEEAARLKKIEEDRKLAEAAELEANGQKDEAEQVLSEPVFTPPPAMQAPPKVEGVSYRDNWKFRITNESQIPREYWVVDAQKIGQVVRATKGSLSIPGIQIYNDKTPIVR